MGWFFSSLKSCRLPSRQSRRAPKRNRSLILEDLEGRRPLSHAIQSFVTLPVTSLNASNIISGPDGDLWVGVNSINPNSDLIEKIGLDGSVTSFPVPVPENAPVQFMIVSLTTGPDGNVWFVADFINSTGTDGQVVIGNVAPTGHVTEFPPIPVPAGQNASVNWIVSGSGGDLWFGYVVADTAYQSQNFIGRVTTAGVVTLFPISTIGPAAHAAGGLSLATGADGNLWFTEGFGKDFVFGRMSPSGVVSRFPIRSQAPGAPGEVGNGPNSSLIVTVENAKGRNEVFQVSTAGAITRYKVPEAISDAFSNYLGSADGSLWFADTSGAFKLGRITASGVATTYNLSKLVHSRFHDFDSMAVGPDGNLYVLDPALPAVNHTTTVYRLSPSELPPVRSVRGHTGGHPKVT